MSQEILVIVLPVFALIGLGYAFARTGILKESSGDALGQFVYIVGIPALLFKTLAVVQLGDQSPWRLWLAYFSGVAIAWFISGLMIRKVFGRDARAGVIGGISSVFSNSAMVGLPLISSVYGEAGQVPLLIILSVHLPAMTIAMALLMERAAAKDGMAEKPEIPALLISVCKNLATNPIILAIGSAVVWRTFSLPVSGVFADVLGRLASAALPVALLSLGTSMVRYGIRGNVLPGVLLSFVKIAVMPALVFSLSAYVFQLPPLWTAVATLTAACPTGINVYIFANRYGTGHAMSANSITLTTIAAVVSTGIWVYLLDLWQMG
ncbi:AEC family transporter [Roseibium litorale]|uniref:AEC family transporter n=1 Tax=Roseibium litorale TaxID=2803841 RepID=A0ABR9CPD8_9HYPH|nr:AEC family transporter [Roseibium litorale]MBD8892121.1 AEC family transporter [Roseibium litorale]